jgi:hypothetical protein
VIVRSDQDIARTVEKLRRLKKLIGKRDPQDAYVHDDHVKTLADAIVADNAFIAGQHVDAYRSKHINIAKRLNLDALSLVAIVGDVGGIENEYDHHSMGRFKYGGLLGAVLHANLDLEPRQIIQYFHQKAEGAIYDFVRRENESKKLSRLAEQMNRVDGGDRRQVFVNNFSAYDKRDNKEKISNGDPVLFQDQLGENGSTAFTKSQAKFEESRKKIGERELEKYYADMCAAAYTLPKEQRSFVLDFLGFGKSASVEEVEITNQRERDALIAWKLAYLQGNDDHVLPMIADGRQRIRQSDTPEQMARDVYAYLRTAGITDRLISNLAHLDFSRISQLHKQNRLPSQLPLSIFGIRAEHLPDKPFAEKYRDQLNTGDWVKKTVLGASIAAAVSPSR